MYKSLYSSLKKRIPFYVGPLIAFSPNSVLFSFFSKTPNTKTLRNPFSIKGSKCD